MPRPFIEYLFKQHCHGCAFRDILGAEKENFAGISPAEGGRYNRSVELNIAVCEMIKYKDWPLAYINN